MTDFKVGDEVLLTGEDWKEGINVLRGTQVTIDAYRDPSYEDLGPVPSFTYEGRQYYIYSLEGEDYSASLASGDAISPSHYQFPGGAEVRHISEWLTANAAQALQYIARSSRIDGQNKGDAAEDIRKAIRFLEFELERLDV